MMRLLASFILLFLFLYVARNLARSLFAAYLHGRQAYGRKHPHAHPHARQRASGAANVMAEEEAYEVLGLQKGATLEEIGEAHRRLMKRIHPDTGGSGWLAGKLNAARDLLVKTHT
jgi:hypothetical protein